jgi:hypothetical protein
MDFITKLPRTDQGMNGILVMVDRLSNLPRVIITDRDTQFMSKFWQQLFAHYGTRLLVSSAYHPETDGKTERTNRTLEEMLRNYVADTRHDWDEYVCHANHAFNSSKQSSTNMSPDMIVFGQEKLMPATMMIAEPSSVPAADDVIQTQQRTIELARQHMIRAMERQKRNADARRRDQSYEVGAYAFVNTQHLSAAGEQSSKLKPKFAGPYRIIAKVNDVAYRLQLPPPSSAHPVFHVSKLRKYYPRLTDCVDDNGDSVVPPAPELVDDEYEYEVEQVLAHKRMRNQNYYLIRWKGYNSWSNSWEPESLLMNAREAIASYKAAQARRHIDDAVKDVQRTARQTRRSVMLTHNSTEHRNHQHHNMMAMQCLVVYGARQAYK